MHKFGKVILSRKGFDSSAGGGYSPFDPQTGKYIVLPIPVAAEELKICNPLKYEEIPIISNYLDGYPETNLKSLMEAMRKKATLQTKGKKDESEYAHFDPWLVDCPWLEGDSKHPIGAFGQVDRPQTYLHSQGVGEGSLFLFFSRFTPIKPIGQNSEKIIVPDISRKNLNKDLYFIYGWLKVKKVIQEYEAIRGMNTLSRHPHATKKYFETHKNNTIYIADEFLFNDGSNIRGCGYFPRLNRDLCLTASDLAQTQKPGNWIPSRWSLPGFFHKNCRSVLKPRKWVKCDVGSDSYLVETNWQWQEAVFDFGESEDFYPWFRKRLESVADNV